MEMYLCINTTRCVLSVVSAISLWPIVVIFVVATLVVADVVYCVQAHTMERYLLYVFFSFSFLLYFVLPSSSDLQALTRRSGSFFPLFIHFIFQAFFSSSVSCAALCLFNNFLLSSFASHSSFQALDQLFFSHCSLFLVKLMNRPVLKHTVKFPHYESNRCLLEWIFYNMFRQIASNYY